MRLENKIKSIVALLNKRYGKPSLLRKSNPIDELVRTILSQNTNDRNSLGAFKILKDNFKSWDMVLKSRTKSLARLIKRAGLANIKARRIKGVLGEIARREGKIGLASLKDLDIDDALAYLRSLKGVGPKTAACVMLFSFGRPVMPVDTHIFRVAKRLGLIDNDLNIEKAHEVLTTIVPKALTLRQSSGSRSEHLSKTLIYEFHLGIIEHGRKVCRAQNPKCGICVLYKLCRFEKKAFFKKRSLV